MRDCRWLSDRIPHVALGGAEWTSEEARHLSGCPICQQEWEVVRAASRLGGGIEERFEADPTARAVLQRLRSVGEASRRRRTWSVAGLAAAAAIVVAVWAGRTEHTVDSAPAARSLAAGRPAFPLPELESLQAAELDSVLRTMDEPSLSGSPAEDPDLADLNQDELERVLDSWEG